MDALISLEYPGDAKLGPFKDHLDKMMRHLRTSLSDRDKLQIVRRKLAKSERLKNHLEHLERLPKTHSDHSYSWLSDLVDKIVEEDQHQENQKSLVLEASGKEQIPKSKVTPGLRQEGGGGGGKGGGTGGGCAGGGGKDQGPKGGEKGGKKGDGKKGGGRGGGKGDAHHSGNTDSESETPSRPKKKTSDYDGIELDAVPESERCCLHYLWTQPNGKSRCWMFNQGKECTKGKHITNPSKNVKNTKLYKSLVDRYGPHNVHNKKPTPPKKE